MKQKLLLLILGALPVFAFSALPTVASAAEWSVDLESGTFPTPITVSGGVVSMTSSLGTISCETVTGTGQYTTATTGHIQFLFHGCKKVSNGDTCTSTGQPAGTTTSTVLVFHDIILEPTPSPTQGILITSNAGHFATFVCGGIFTVKVEGNGIIGEVTTPTCSTGTFQKTANIRFSSTGTGNQLWKQVETAGTAFDLTTEGFGLKATASEDGEGTIEFTSTKAKMTCP